MIQLKLKKAAITDRRKIYEWLCLSDITPMCLGEPDYPQHPVPAWEDFETDYADFYFSEEGGEKGGVFLIEHDGEETGSVSYSCFHLQPYTAELDIWMKNRAHCGKGYGVAALTAIMDYLNGQLGINRFIIRPSEKNVNAVKAYEKAGFTCVTDKAATIKEYMLEEYIGIYGEGDYGTDSTATMIREV